MQETSKNPPSILRVAWLMPTLVRGPYWQPLLKEFSRLFPCTVVFTANWPGYLRGYEAAFVVRQLGGFKFVARKRTETGSEVGFTRAPVSILSALRRFCPAVIFTASFTIWTLYALVHKCYRDCRVVAVWDGTSPVTAALDSPWRLAIRRLMARSVDAFITNSREGASYLQHVLGIPEHKILRHLYQVPEPAALCATTDSAAFHKPNARPVFLFLGRLITGKGCRYLLEAAALLVEKGMTSFSVVLAGEGEQRQDLASRVTALHLEGIVHLVGQVRYEDLGALFRASDVFVFPTLEDVWAVVVLEAMAFAKPVLCSQYAGAKEMVQHGLNGFVFDPRNPGKLAEYMEQFIRHLELIAKFGQKSQEIISPYTPARAAKALESLVLRLRDASDTAKSACPRRSGAEPQREGL